MTGPPLIELHNATIWRGQNRVFDGLELTIEQHERVAILGPNGSGKTTLLKTINRELYPVAGSDSWVRILGRERWNVWELRKRIGIVSDDLQHRYTPWATALEVVLSGFHASIGMQGTLAHRVTEAEREDAVRVLHELGVGDMQDRALEHLSTGEQRRVLLGRALVHRPSTLILDEPTTGLDLAASFDYLARIRKLALAGTDIVLVTHHLNEIPPEVERIVLLSDGRVVADGDKAAVLTGERLSAVYGTAVRVIEVDSYFLAYPGRD